MVFKTPLEKSLEIDLEVIGIPFTGRRTIVDETFEKFLIRQKPDYQIINQAVVESFRRMGENTEGLESKTDSRIMLWESAQHLVYRTTKDLELALPQDVVLEYWVYPTDKNIETLKQITDYEELQKQVDDILLKREFYYEGMEIFRYDGGQILEILFLPLNINGKTLGHHAKSRASKGVPKDIFAGATSPIIHTPLISSRVVSYLQKINK